MNDERTDRKPRRIYRLAATARHVLQAAPDEGPVLFSRSGWPWLIVGLLLATMLYAPVFLNFDFMNLDDDAMRVYQFFGIARESILDFHEIPVRTFYLGGGFPVLSHPEFPLGNPMLIPVLLFGEVKGMKIHNGLAFAVAFWGMFWFARRILRLGRVPAFFAGMLLCFCGMYPLQLDGGDYEYRYFLYFPLLLGSTILASRDSRWIAAAALLLAVMLTDGSMTAASIAFFLGVYALCASFGFEKGRLACSWRPIGAWAAVAALALGLTMFRVLPALMFLGEARPGARSYTGRELDIFDTSLGDFLPSLFGNDPVFGAFHLGGFVGVLALIGLLAYGRRWLRLLVAAGIAFWLCSATLVRPDLFHLLWHLPFFGSMVRPGDYFFFYLGFTVILLAAGALQPLANAPWKLPAALASVVIIVAATAPVFLKSTNALAEVHGHRVPDRPRVAAFHTVANDFFPGQHGQAWKWDADYPNHYLWFLQGFGPREWAVNYTNRTAAVPRCRLAGGLGAWRFEESPAYQGEVFFDNPANRVRLVRVTGSTVTANVRLATPGRLIVNQNHDPRWQSDHGVLVNADGLLGIDLDSPGEYRIHLTYRPWDFYIGLAVSLASLVVVCRLGLRRPRAARQRPAGKSTGWFP